MRRPDETVTLPPGSPWPHTDAPPPAATGTRFDGIFEVVATRAGGMGVVHLGHLAMTDRFQAAKTFRDGAFNRADGSINHDLVNGFMREAVTWMALPPHRNVVRADTALKFQGQPFLFLEYVTGHERRSPELGEWLSVTRTDSSVALDFAIQICRGMVHLHGQSVVHGDLKPSNLLVARGGVVKITDLGLARAATAISPQLAAPVGMNAVRATNAGGTAGTPAYMPPEQWNSARLMDNRSDIYAFGATLYEMLTGRPPFTVPDEMTGAHPAMQVQFIKDAHLRAPIPDPRFLNPKIPGDVALIVARCLAKTLGDRPTSFDVVERDLAQAYARREGAPAGGVDLPSAWHSVELGFAALAEGEAERAATRFKVALQLDSLMAHAHLGLADAAIAQENLGEAAQHLATCIRTYPEVSAAWNSLGYLHHLRNDERTAIRYYEHALSLHPQSWAAWNNLGMAHTNLGDFNAAHQALDKALAIFATYPDAVQNKAFAFAQSGRFLEAADWFKAALKLRPTSAGVVIQLIKALYNAGAYDAAAVVARALEEQRPGNSFTPPFIDKARQAHAAGVASVPFDVADLDLSIEFKPLPTSSPSRGAGAGTTPESPAVIEAIGWFEIGEHARALAVARRLADREPENRAARSVVAQCLLELGRKAEAAATARSVVGKWPDDENAFSVLSICESDAGLYDEALTHAAAAIEASRRTWGDVKSARFNNRGNIFHRTGRYEEAVADYRAALATDGRNFLAMENLAVCLNDMGRHHDALASVLDAIGVQPLSPSGWRVHGNILNALGRQDEAARSSARAAELNRAAQLKRG